MRLVSFPSPLDFIVQQRSWKEDCVRAPELLELKTLDKSQSLCEIISRCFTTALGRIGPSPSLISRGIHPSGPQTGPKFGSGTCRERNMGPSKTLVTNFESRVMTMTQGMPCGAPESILLILNEGSGEGQVS